MSNEKYHLLIIRDLIISVIIILTLTLSLAGCSSKQGNENNVNDDLESLNQYKDGTVLSGSLSKRQVLDMETFAKEMRAQNRTVEVKDLNMPKEISFIMRKKNISDNTRVCFSDIDCASDGMKCITQCKYSLEGDVWDGRVFFCNIDQFRNDTNMRFMADFGFCLDKIKWPY